MMMMIIIIVISTTSNVIVDEEAGILHPKEGHPGHGVSNYKSPEMEETYNMKIQCRAHLCRTPERRCSYTGTVRSDEIASSKIKTTEGR